MKLPYFYQHMLGFLAVIIILLYTSLFSFIRLSRESAFNSTQEDLFTYAETIVESANDYDDLSREQRILDKFNVNIAVVDNQGKVVYPSLTPNIVSRIIPEDLEDLKAGERQTSIVELGVDGEEENHMMVYVPYFSQSTGEYGGFVSVMTPFSIVDDEINALEGHLFRAFFIATIVSIIISALLAWYQVNRINRLRKAAHKVTQGEYDVRVSYSDRDELDNLSRDFNKMILALDQSQKELDRQEERRKSFMQDAAHEMRTPLTTINGLLEGLEYGIIDESNRLRSIQLMRKETTRLIKLVNENLDYENIRSNRIKLIKKEILLSNIFEEIDYQMKKLSKKSNNTLNVEDMKDMTVFADYDRLKQILVNLIKNAIQFTDNGEINVWAEKTEYGTKLFIQDNGIGMSEKQLKNIWERYYKADTSRQNTLYGESGLGLSIVQQLVHLHGAVIDVRSKENKGTLFSVEFPDSPELEKELQKNRQQDILE